MPATEFVVNNNEVASEVEKKLKMISVNQGEKPALSDENLAIALSNETRFIEPMINKNEKILKNSVDLKTVNNTLQNDVINESFVNQNSTQNSSDYNGVFNDYAEIKSDKNSYSEISDTVNNSTKTSNSNVRSDINIDMSGMVYNMHNESNIDDVISEISKKLSEALNAGAQGVHI